MWKAFLILNSRMVNPRCARCGGEARPDPIVNAEELGFCQGLRTKITKKVLMVNQSGGLSFSNRAQSVSFGRMMDGKMIF